MSHVPELFFEGEMPKSNQMYLGNGIAILTFKQFEYWLVVLLDITNITIAPEILAIPYFF